MNDSISKTSISKSWPSLKSQVGMTLIEVLIMFGVLSILSLTMISLFNQSLKVNSMIQEQLEAADLDRTIQAALRDYQSCKTALGNLQVGPINSKRTFQQFVGAGNVLIARSNQNQDRLRIGQMSFVNESIPGANSSGFINIEVPLTPSSSESLLQALKPLQFKVFVSTNASGRIENCSGGGMLSNCTVRSFTSSGPGGSNHCCEPDEVFISGTAPLDPANSSFSWTNKRCSAWIDVEAGHPIQMLCCR